jgi:hypothetical protein
MVCAQRANLMVYAYLIASDRGVWEARCDETEVQEFNTFLALHKGPPL